MKNRYVLLADLLLIPVAALVAFAARFDWAFLGERPEFVPYVLAALVIKPAVFVALGMYRRYWRYTSIHDLSVVLLAVTFSSMGMALFVAVSFGRFPLGFSRMVVFNDWLVTLAAVGGLRVAIRVVYDSALRGRTERTNGTQRRVLIIGAGAAGTIVVRELRRNPQLGMEPVGFLDDDKEKIGKYLSGLRVLGSTASLPEKVSAHRVNHVLIAMPTVRGPVVRNIIENCRAAGVTAQTVPGVLELLGDQFGITRLRTVEISDLLRRAPVKGQADIAQTLTGHVVLITGGGGSIGSELARQVARVHPSHLVLLGHGENSLFNGEAVLRQAFPGLKLTTVVADTRDESRMASIFDRFKPEIVFHAAAHKHVPMMENNPEEAVTNNILGTRNIVRQALRAGTKRLVLISTDKAVAPTSVMGATKRLAEALVRRAARESGRAFVVVRFGNVLGSRGSVVNTFQKQIESGGPVTVTHPEMTRFFMTIPEAVHLVLQASGQGKGGELFVLDMGEPVKIVDLARDLIVLSGLSPDGIAIEFTGMRPGEKLHESLIDAGATTRPTAHPDVLEVTEPDAQSPDSLDALIDRLEAAALKSDKSAIQALLTEGIP